DLLDAYLERSPSPATSHGLAEQAVILVLEPNPPKSRTLSKTVVGGFVHRGFESHPLR
ncbi:MAG: hypothetical protein QOK04_1941, partial [Solirubrobacteraceae bacterium]|nr:hypothetical protein [Solirubrobacteraceae bacterium]